MRTGAGTFEVAYRRGPAAVEDLRLRWWHSSDLAPGSWSLVVPNLHPSTPLADGWTRHSLTFARAHPRSFYFAEIVTP